MQGKTGGQLKMSKKEVVSVEEEMKFRRRKRKTKKMMMIRSCV